MTKFTRTFWKQEDGSDQMRKVLTIDLVHVRSGDDEEDWMDRGVQQLTKFTYTLDTDEEEWK